MAAENSPRFESPLRIEELAKFVRSIAVVKASEFARGLAKEAKEGIPLVVTDDLIVKSGGVGSGRILFSFKSEAITDGIIIVLKEKYTEIPFIRVNPCAFSVNILLIAFTRGKQPDLEEDEFECSSECDSDCNSECDSDCEEHAYYG